VTQLYAESMQLFAAVLPEAGTGLSSWAGAQAVARIVALSLGSLRQNAIAHDRGS